MNRSALKYTALMVLMLIISPMQSGDAAPGLMSKQKAWQLLKAGDSVSVQALPEGEREILMATLALDEGNTAEAIEILSSKAVENSQLAALIRAEAYRRQSLQAARRAGNYAHAVSDDIRKLKRARVSLGLDEAEKRLHTFRATASSRKAPTQVAAAIKKVRKVIIREPAVQSALPESVRSTIETWRKDWESRNADIYLSHYHPAFATDRHDFNSWSRYKRRVNGRKTYINVSISNLRMIRGPEQIREGEAVLVAFDQQYRSSNYSANSSKQLYLVRDNSNQWLILFEGEGGKPFVRKTGSSTTQVAVSNKAALTADKTGDWAINLGSFDSEANAKQMAGSINITGFQQPFVSDVSVGNKQLHRVRIGLYESRKAAVDAMVNICPQLGLNDCWLEQAGKK